MITINLNKAKNVAHDLRRSARSEEFAPLDKVIAAQIPGVDVVAAEAERQAIRDKYAVMQEAIDASTSVDEIKQALNPPA